MTQAIKLNQAEASSVHDAKAGMVLEFNAAPDSKIKLTSSALKTPSTNWAKFMAVMLERLDDDPAMVVVNTNPNHPTEGWKLFKIIP